MAVIAFRLLYITEKRADHSLRDEQGRFRPRSFLCAVAPRFSVDVQSPKGLACWKLENVFCEIFLKSIDFSKKMSF